MTSATLRTEQEGKGDSSLATEQVRAGELLQLSDERLRRAVAAAGMTAWEWDVRSQTLRGLDNDNAFFGLPPRSGDKDDHDALAAVAEEDHPLIRDATARSLETGEDFQCEFRGRRPLPDGSPRWFSSRGQLERDASGQPLRLVGMTWDISRWKQKELSALETEKTLQKSEAEARKLAMIASRTHNGVILADALGRIEWINDGFTRMTGYVLDEVRGRTPGSLLQGPGSDPQVDDEMRQAVRGGRGFTAEMLNYHKSGREYWVAIEVRPIRDDVGRVTHFMAIESDITEQKRAEDALRESEERFSKAFHSNPVAMAIRRLNDDVIVDWNPAFERIFGYSREELAGKKVDELSVYVRPEDRPTVLAHIDRRETIYGKEMEFRNRAGDVMHLIMTVNYISLWGEPCGLASFIDITERKQAEQQTATLRDELAHVARLGTLGEIASGLAHELNQPLAAMHVDANTALELAAGSKSAALHRCLNRMSEQSLRAGKIVRRMRSFARHGPTRRAPDDVNQLIREVLLLLDDELRHNGAQLNLSLEENLRPVLVDGIQIQQVLVNLIRNALEAMAPYANATRSLSIDTRTVEDQVHVSISDTGGGIEPAIAARLFNPFQTTKPNGLGLGLAICRTLIEAHGGRIDAHSNPAGGTTFTFLLPAARERVLA